LRFAFFYFSHFPLSFFASGFVPTNSETRFPKITRKNKKTTYPGFLARGLWNFFLYGGSRSAAASSQKCAFRDSYSSRSNNTQFGETFSLLKKGTWHRSRCQYQSLGSQRTDASQQLFGCGRMGRRYALKLIQILPLFPRVGEILPGLPANVDGQARLLW
jgi:hypothetical protein